MAQLILSKLAIAEKLKTRYEDSIPIVSDLMTELSDVNSFFNDSGPESTYDFEADNFYHVFQLLNPAQRRIALVIPYDDAVAGNYSLAPITDIITTMINIKKFMVSKSVPVSGKIINPDIYFLRDVDHNDSWMVRSPLEPGTEDYPDVVTGEIRSWITAWVEAHDAPDQPTMPNHECYGLYLDNEGATHWPDGTYMPFPTIAISTVDSLDNCEINIDYTGFFPAGEGAVEVKSLDEIVKALCDSCAQSNILSTTLDLIGQGQYTLSNLAGIYDSHVNSMSANTRMLYDTLKRGISNSSPLASFCSLLPSLFDNYNTGRVTQTNSWEFDKTDYSLDSTVVLGWSQVLTTAASVVALVSSFFGPIVAAVGYLMAGAASIIGNFLESNQGDRAVINNDAELCSFAVPVRQCTITRTIGTYATEDLTRLLVDKGKVMFRTPSCAGYAWITGKNTGSNTCTFALEELLNCDIQWGEKKWPYSTAPNAPALKIFLQQFNVASGNSTFCCPPSEKDAIYLEVVYSSGSPSSVRVTNLFTNSPVPYDDRWKSIMNRLGLLQSYSSSGGRTIDPTLSGIAEVSWPSGKTTQRELMKRVWYGLFLDALDWVRATSVWYLNNNGTNNFTFSLPDGAVDEYSSYNDIRDAIFTWCACVTDGTLQSTYMDPYVFGSGNPSSAQWAFMIKMCKMLRAVKDSEVNSTMFTVIDFESYYHVNRINGFIYQQHMNPYSLNLTSNMPAYFISDNIGKGSPTILPPKYEYNLWVRLGVTLGICLLTVGAAIVAKRIISNKIGAKNAILYEQVNRNRTEYVNNPSKATYKKYYKSYKRYNRRAALLNQAQIGFTDGWISNPVDDNNPAENSTVASWIGSALSGMSYSQENVGQVLYRLICGRPFPTV